MSAPIVTLIGDFSKGLGWKRYRLEGGTLDPEWAASLRPDEVAWCEVTTTDGKHLGSYGGSVWPGAWPDLFTPTRIMGNPVTLITDAGKALLAQAEGA